MRHSLKVRLDDQKKNWRWDDQTWSREWIIQTTSAKDNLNRISQITSHISRQDAKHVISILSQQTVSAFTASKFLFEELTSLYSSQQWFVYRISSSRAKKEIIASEKAYNRHVLEEKQFTNKTFIFIYYRLLFEKLKHDSIFSWSVRLSYW
jgi:hypothetical protein